MNKYTEAKVVVMICIFDFTCTFPNDSQLIDLKDVWHKIADRYKANTYVWFNLINEPGWSDSGAQIEYLDIHQALISEIRDSVGANNVIVIDGTQCGQDLYTWDNNEVNAASSGIITFGNSLINFNDKAYENILFSVHFYDQWAYNDGYFTNKLDDYIRLVREEGLELIIGETGTTGLHDTDRRQSTKLAYYAYTTYGVGMLAWHWEPKDGFQLVKDSYNSYRGDQIDNTTNPTNLSPWEGYYFWKAAHEFHVD